MINNSMLEGGGGRDGGVLSGYVRCGVVRTALTLHTITDGPLEVTEGERR